MKKTFVALLLVLTLVCTSVLAEGAFVKGTYEGTAPGFGGDVKVTVEVDGEKIVSVKAEGPDETVGIGSNAIDQLPATIVAKQTLKVDAVAGCTVSSEAVLKAAEQALRAAGASDDVIFAEPKASEAKAEDEIISTNVLIIGAGASGLAAALSAHNNGVEDVLVIEKMPIVGGATSLAGGGMTAYRVDEDPEITEANKEEMFTYWCRTGKFTNNARLTMLAVELSTPCIEWMKEVGVGVTGQPDPEKAFVSYGCAGHAVGAINSFYELVQEANVPVMLNTRAEHLITADGKVIGAEAIGSEGQKLTIMANTVLLATGGYGNNLDFVTDEDVLTRTIYYGPVCSTGDGHIMAQELGIPLFNMDKVATKHFGVETEPGFGIHIHGTVAKLYNTTGAIAVNKACQRVVNEAGDQLDIALASMYKSEDGRLYMVMDQAAYDVCRDSLVNNKYFAQEDLDRFIAENGTGVTKLVKGETLADAAKAIGLDPAALEETVKEYNENIANGGKDPFKRRFTAELGEGPYYIMQTVARFATTLGGVNVNNQLQVLDVNEQPVEGLYAAGEVVGNIHGSYAHYLIWCIASGMEFGNIIAK